MKKELPESSTSQKLRVTNSEDLVKLARAALAVAAGEAKPEDFSTEIAIHLGDVSIETRELAQSVNKVAVWQFAAAVNVFNGILREQGVDLDEGEENQLRRKAVSGQLAVQLSEQDLRLLYRLICIALDIHVQMSKMG
jgi:hypothetical protein